MVTWPQSLPLCIVFSFMAGLCLVLSTTCLAVTKTYVEKKKKNTKKRERRRRRGARKKQEEEVEIVFSRDTNTNLEENMQDEQGDDSAEVDNELAKIWGALDKTIEEEGGDSDEPAATDVVDSKFAKISGALGVTIEEEGGGNDIDESAASDEVDESAKTWWALGYFGNILFQMLSFGFQTFSTFVGPISIAVPVSVSSQLLSNIVIFGLILKYEKLSKDTLVGTLVDSVGVFLLIFVGATFEDTEPDILELLGTRKAYIWISVIIACSAISFPYHFLLGCSESSLVTGPRTFGFLMMSEVFNSILAASTLKMLALLTGKDLAIAVVATVYANGMLLYASMLRAVAVERQSIYLPIAITFYLGMNAITGALVWEDDIQSKGGYLCVFVLFGLSGFLLSDFELTSASNAQFKYGSVVERGFSVVQRRETAFNTKAKARRGISIAEIPAVYARLSTGPMVPGVALNARLAREELRQEKSTKASVLAFIGSANYGRTSSPPVDKSLKDTTSNDEVSV